MRIRGIEGRRALVDVADDAVRINYEGHPVGKEVREAEDAIRFGHALFGVAQQGKGGLRLGRKFPISVLAIDADSQHLGAGDCELGDISLIRLDLLGSPRRRSPEVECQDYRHLPAEILQANDLTVLVWEREIRRAIANL